MKRFQFRLQKLLELKGHKEKLIKNELAVEQGKKNLILNEKEKIKQEYQSGLSKMRDTENESFLTAGDMLNYQKYFYRLKASTKVKDEEIARQDKVIFKINDRLVEARKDKKVLDRLKEKKIKEYQYEWDREEQNFFDEVGTNQYIADRKKVPAEAVKEIPKIPIKYKEYDKNISEKVYQQIIHELEGKKS